LGPCVPPFSGLENHQWLTGDYQAVLAAPEHQAVMLQRVKRGALKKLDRAAARAVTGGEYPLPEAAHYYLIRAGYVGPPEAAEYVRFGVDVDAEGVADVSSLALSMMTDTSEAAIILASPTPIRRFISSCGSAQ
jgi:hypothetical protein